MRTRLLRLLVPFIHTTRVPFIAPTDVTVRRLFAETRNIEARNIPARNDR